MQSLHGSPASLQGSDAVRSAARAQSTAIRAIGRQLQKLHGSPDSLPGSNVVRSAGRAQSTVIKVFKVSR